MLVYVSCLFNDAMSADIILYQVIWHLKREKCGFLKNNDQIIQINITTVKFSTLHIQRKNKTTVLSETLITTNRI
jgi:hypothetical protein